MNSVEASERIDKALEILTQEGILTPLDVNDPEVRNALNKAQEDLIERLIKDLYETD